ncbi:UNVERIFIED_CONTAM: hypothetical protein K2H54_047509 [Gekko kuhli]
MLQNRCPSPTQFQISITGVIFAVRHMRLNIDEGTVSIPLSTVYGFNRNRKPKASIEIGSMSVTDSVVREKNRRQPPVPGCSGCAL